MQTNEVADAFGFRDFRIRRVPLDAPWRWLSAGWADLCRVAPISAAYGSAFAALAAVMLLGLWTAGAGSLMIALAGGFLLVAPMLACGLYEASRRLQAGQAVALRHVVFVRTANPGQLVVAGLLLGLLLIVWIDLAVVVFALFFGLQPFPSLDAFVSALLLTGPGVATLIVGTIAGGAMAALVFVISVVSIPLLMITEIDVVTAMAVSVRAVSRNPRPLALWAALIAAATAVGFACAIVGLVVVFPLLAHASWHAFEDLVGDGLSDGR